MFDLLNPLDGLLARARHGQMHRFTWPQSSDFTGIEVESILQRYGIPCWGRQVSLNPGDDYGLLVKASQAVWAEHLLCKAGVPLSSQLLDPRNAAYAERAGGTMPPAWGVPAKPKGLVGPIVAGLAGALGIKPVKRVERSAKRQTGKRGRRASWWREVLDG